MAGVVEKTICGGSFLKGLRLAHLLVLAHRQRGLEPVQLHGPDLGGDVLLQELLVGRLLARRGGEVDLLDPDVLQRHLARALVHLRVRGEGRDAEDRRGLRRRLDADGAVRFEQATVPVVELGQVEADRRLARLHHARPVRRGGRGARRERVRGRHRRARAAGRGLSDRARFPRQPDQRAERGAPADALRRGRLRAPQGPASLRLSRAVIHPPLPFGPVTPGAPERSRSRPSSPWSSGGRRTPWQGLTDAGDRMGRWVQAR